MGTFIPAIETLVRLFEELTPAALGRVHLYRGHPDKSYILQPSTYRKSYDEKENLREMLASHPDKFREDRTAFEQLVRMQHYGAPTRLLDLTYNPLVALYFSCARENRTDKEQSVDGQLIRLSLKKSDIKYFDSDTVSCVANLASLTECEQTRIATLNSDELNGGDRVGEKLLSFIRAEKPYFLPRIVPEHLRSIFAVHPKQSNPRILAQQGAFFLFGSTKTLDEGNSFDIEVSVFATIPHDKKGPLLSELDGININNRTLFPEIASTARAIALKV